MKVAADNDPRARFGQAVRKYRLAAGLSQERLAELAGIHRNYAGAVERGERNVALINMVRIARALGVALGNLVEGVDGAASQTDRAAPRGRNSRPKR